MLMNRYSRVNYGKVIIINTWKARSYNNQDLEWFKSSWRTEGTTAYQGYSRIFCVSINGVLLVAALF